MPTFTTPPTFSSGEVLTASDLDVLGDDISYLYQQSTQVSFYGTRQTRSIAATTSDSAFHDIGWDTETFDIGGWLTGSGSDIIVPAVAIPSGLTNIVVLVAAQGSFVANATGTRIIRILKDGAEWGRMAQSGIGGGDRTPLAITDFVTAVSGTVIKLQVWQNSGGSLDVDSLRINVVRYGALS
jgi:hypothetical protein